MKLSQKQQEAFDECLNFFLQSNKKLFVLSGVAGSGKSVIINEIVEFFNNEFKEFCSQKQIAVMTLTGKAAKVLRDKGVEEAQTIHSYLYKPLLDTEGQLISFVPVPKEQLKNDFIIIDEGSMVTKEIYDDLKKLKKKILVVGDINQLEPVVINGKSNFNLMSDPDVRLEEIHRQAEGSPIIVLSQYILETGRLPKETFHDDIKYIKYRDATDHLTKNANLFDITLCATHAMRTKLNKAVRKHYGRFGRYPEVGDKVICLRNNTHRIPSTFNGEIFEVIEVDDDLLEHSCDDDDMRRYKAVNGNKEEYELMIEDDIWFNGTSAIKNTIKFENMFDFYGNQLECFPDIFDFSGAITVHKSQGSEFDNIMYVNQDVSGWCDQQRFLYTAVTRAKKTLTIAK
jgi:ATP-dependent exoDNAse (exonuclease V) alpha subunit